jgi:hypothetical protein
MLLPQYPPDWRITDCEWRSIAGPVNLPEEARKALEVTIHTFRVFSVGEESTRRPSPKKRRAKLKRTAQAGRDFIAALSSLGSPETIHLEFVLPANRRREEIVAAKLTAARNRVQLIVDRCDEAASSVGPRRRHRDKGLLRDFVRHLDRILLKHTGKQIKRSSKPQQPIVQFVRTACKVFDPRVGNGSIDQAMKAAIRARGKIRE